MAVLVTGGARSGKSRFAEAYAARQGTSGFYIATSQVFDEEMQERVDRHQERRQQSAFAWTTVEEPYELFGELAMRPDAVVLVDCLTLWLTNWLLRYEHQVDAEKKVMAKVGELAELLEKLSDRIVVVTNEVGDGIVPESPLGRQFRDLAGWMNQRIAAACRKVFLVTAGIPVELKSLSYTFPDEAARGGKSDER